MMMWTSVGLEEILLKIPSERGKVIMRENSINSRFTKNVQSCFIIGIGINHSVCSIQAN